MMIISLDDRNDAISSNEHIVGVRVHKMQISDNNQLIYFPWNSFVVVVRLASRFPH